MNDKRIIIGIAGGLIVYGAFRFGRFCGELKYLNWLINEFEGR